MCEHGHQRCKGFPSRTGPKVFMQGLWRRIFHMRTFSLNPFLSGLLRSFHMRTCFSTRSKVFKGPGLMGKSICPSPNEFRMCMRNTNRKRKGKGLNVLIARYSTVIQIVSLLCLLFKRRARPSSPFFLRDVVTDRYFKSHLQPDVSLHHHIGTISRSKLIAKILVDKCNIFVLFEMYCI